MLGKTSSVASKLLELAPQAIIVHAVAHRHELSYSAAYAEVPYLGVIEDIIKFVYNRYHSSPKKNDSLKELAKVLEQDEILKFRSIHGIRWMASKKGALKTLLRNYVPVVLDLKQAALSEGALTESSPPGDFMGKSFKVLNSETSRMVRAKVTQVPLTSGGPSLNVS